MALANTGAALQHLTPRPVKGLFGDNYLSVADMDFTQQFLPEVYEKEVERYGKRTVGGFLRMVGAEMPMASDRIVWSEQGRLHIAHDGVDSNAAGTELEINGLGATDQSLIGVGQTLVVSNGTVTAKARVDSLGTFTPETTGGAADGTLIVNIKVYGEASAVLPAALKNKSDGSINIFVFGSEYGKGSGDVGNSFDASFTTFENKPIILRDKYNVNGSDVAQIGWVEVTTEAGTGGYLWYLKSEHEARLRFEDYLEMSMVETEKAGQATIGTGITGSEGMFEAIETRGLVYNSTDFGGANGLAQFDEILAELDKQGAIEENMLFLDRSTSLGMDNMLAAQNSYGAGGTSYGVFNNEEDMALNLGFSGFRRGSYDFYKSDFKYLNDKGTRGALNDTTTNIRGVVIPAGVSSVYDEMLGRNMKRPFLHVRYRQSQTESRKMKTWVTGSVGAMTSGKDTMEVHYLSERCLITQGANNFMLIN